MNTFKTILRLILYIIGFPVVIIMTGLCWLLSPIILFTELINWLCNKELYFIDLGLRLIISPFICSYDWIFKGKFPG